MKSKRASPRRWRFRAGEHGGQVTVYERSSGGPLYARTGNGRGGYIKVSLGHRDREAAKIYALDQAAKLKQGSTDLIAGRVTLARVFSAYLSHHSPRKSLQDQAEDRRRVDMWTRFLGSSKEAGKITRGEWERFSDLRLSGALAPDASIIQEGKREAVRARTVQSDLQWLRWCLGWATTWQDSEGRYFLASNPVRGFEMPSERNPKRPVASTDRLEKVLAAAELLPMELRWGGKAQRQRAYLADVLTLAAETGRRISAILAIRWDDLQWEAKPFGAIRWRSEEDKMGREWVTPISPRSRAALERMRSERPGIGSTYLFPNPTRPDQPVTYERVRHWLLKAEKAAKVPKQDGGSFHPYRRAWATARKHLPLKDVAEAGGWKSEAVLLRHYQQPDEATLLAVVLGGAELRERNG